MPLPPRPPVCSSLCRCSAPLSRAHAAPHVRFVRAQRGEESRPDADVIDRACLLVSPPQTALPTLRTRFAHVRHASMSAPAAATAPTTTAVSIESMPAATVAASAAQAEAALAAPAAPSPTSAAAAALSSAAANAAAALAEANAAGADDHLERFSSPPLTQVRSASSKRTGRVMHKCAWAHDRLAMRGAHCHSARCFARVISC